MRKLLVGMVVLASAAGVSACGKHEKAKTTTPVGQTDVAVPKTADVTAVVKNDEPVVFETEKGLRFTLVLGEGKSGFKFRSTMLSDDAKAKIDEMFETVDVTDAHFEIEGYSDNLGSKEVNEQYGRARAKAVKEYLGEQFGIAGDRISVVSYGMEKPVGDNSTPEGRAQNRRVVIKVMD